LPGNLDVAGQLGGTSIVDHSHYLIRRIAQKLFSAVADPSGTYSSQYSKDTIICGFLEGFLLNFVSRSRHHK
jgi:hypothetical protein